MTATRDLLDGINGRDVLGARTNARGSIVITQPSRHWPFLRASGEREHEERPGGGMIRTATGLLFALGLGLLAVSYAAQFRYVMEQRHQSAASVIEAGALDVGMVIFSLLALGLARAGLAAKAERGLIVACAAGSAVMNYAAADVTSPRSVLAFIMPPVFLAVVVDRVVVTVRRHVLGMREGRSPWVSLGKVTLYALRFALAPWPTATGLRRFVLAATPLPAISPAAQVKASRGGAASDHGESPRAPTKTARFLALAGERHDLATVPLDRVSAIATELATETGLHPGTGRRVLLGHVRALRDGSGG